MKYINSVKWKDLSIDTTTARSIKYKEEISSVSATTKIFGII